MNSKRPLVETSPDQIEVASKKFLFSPNMTETTNADVFSWEKLCNLLDVKLKDVTRKDDLSPILLEIEGLKQENIKLKDDIRKLTTRVEVMDRKSRSSNVVVSGLSCSTITDARSKFADISKNLLNSAIPVSSTRMLSSGKFMFCLESSTTVQSILAAKSKLKGKKIFIQKDYTEDDQKKRYNLRRISKSISAKKPNIKVRLGEFCVYIDDKKYTWSSGKLNAFSEADSDFLRKILSECECSVEVVCKISNNISSE